VDLDRAAKSLEVLYAAGALSDETRDALVAAPAASAKILAGLGMGSTGRDLLLAALLVDDSTSIAANMAEIRTGHRLMLDALRAEVPNAAVQVHTRALNHGVIAPYQDLARVTELNEYNYSGSSLVPKTPLYLQSLLTLGTVLVKTQEEEQRGAAVRTFSLIITDGVDNSSRAIRPLHVKGIVADMLEFSTNHIVAGMGVGERVDYRQIFRSMGIPDRWIFTPGTSIEELRRVFGQIARSLALAASSEVAFAQLLSGPPSDGS
jgi:hypothetical protein